MKWKTEVINVDSLQVSPELLDLYASLQEEGEEGEEGSDLQHLVLRLPAGCVCSRWRTRASWACWASSEASTLKTWPPPPSPSSRSMRQVALHPAWPLKVMVMEAEFLYFWNCLFPLSELCRNQEIVGGASWHGYHQRPPSKCWLCPLSSLPREVPTQASYVKTPPKEGKLWYETCL